MRAHFLAYLRNLGLAKKYFHWARDRNLPMWLSFPGEWVMPQTGGWFGASARALLLGSLRPITIGELAGAVLTLWVAHFSRHGSD